MESALLLLLLVAIPSPSSAVTYNSVTANSLFDFKMVLGNTTKASGLPDWGATWNKTDACSTWQYTTCDDSGNLLSLTLVGKRLEGIIPSSFYSITTLQSLDLHNNRLYGNVNRYLADINQNLYYLDLSSNFFSGQYPDKWTNPAINIDSTSILYPLVLGNNRIYINISHTYFTGYQTIYASTQNTQGYPYSCIGSETEGDSSFSCITVSPANWTGYTPADCGFPAVAATPRAQGQCDTFCGAGTAFGLCHNRAASQCIPTFASATNNTVISHACLAGAPDPIPPPPPLLAVPIKASDAALLDAFIIALGIPPYFASYSVPCSVYFPAVGCDAAGAITSLALGNTGAGFNTSILANIKYFPNLQSLSIPSNGLYGPWPFDTATDLPNLIYLDLSNNFMSGPAPSSFASTLLFLNISNNYFSGSPTITDATGGYYCPENDIFEAQNCLTNFFNSPCPGQAQRTAAECAAFCGIVTTPTLTQEVIGPCNGVLSAVCIPTKQATGPLQGQCSGDVVPSPPPPSSISAPIHETQLLWLAGQWTKMWGTPASVFSSWIKGAPCSSWSGLTCHNGQLIAVSLPNKGIIGPFPGPAFVQGLFWSYNSYSSTVKYIDLSGNKLYGKLDPLLAKITNVEYLDISKNALTGALPAILLGTFKYLNVSNNFFTGSSTMLGLDGATAYCPGTMFEGSLDANCFDVAPTSAFACASKAANGTAKLCIAFCGGVSSSSTSKNLPRCKAGQSCKPSGTSFVCSKS